MSVAPDIRTARLAQPAALVLGLRPHQWTKNLLLFAGLLFSGSLHDGFRWVETLAAFAAYCLLSSAAYLVNDVRDAPRDRLHPTKRLRPVASGALAPRTALAAAATLAASGLALTVPLGWDALWLGALFLVGQLAYTLWLKRVVGLDAAAIAALFVVRAAAGADAIGVRISDWLLVCTALLALFLTFAKRRGELLTFAGELSAGRAVLRHYALGRLGALVWGTAALACGAYAVYAASAHDSEMLLTVPLVVFGLARYLWLVQRRDLGEEPDRVLLTDVPILATVLLWGVVAATALNAL